MGPDMEGERSGSSHMAAPPPDRDRAISVGAGGGQAPQDPWEVSDVVLEGPGQGLVTLLLWDRVSMILFP